MARKSSKDASRALEDFVPWIRQLGYERFISDQQIFDRKHKVRPLYRELKKFQLREVLLCADLHAKKFGKQLYLRQEEKRLLKRFFKSDGITLLGLAATIALLASLWMSFDIDNDGVPDIIQRVSITTPSVEKPVK